MTGLQIDSSTGTSINPADLTDPENQRKTAANVLSQLGLHPDQTGARNLLDMHFQGPTANPEIRKIIPSTDPLVNPAPNLQTPAPEAPLPTIPGPTYSSPTFTSPSINTSGQTLQDQDKLHQLISSGSGISQIKNPFLRGLGHVGEIASDIITPNLTKDIPGTEAHHQMLVGGQEKLVDADLNQQGKEASTAHEEQATTDLQNAPDKNPNELAIWIQQNGPDKPISEYWKQKANAAQGKLTPDELLMRSLTLPVEEGGQNMPVPDAYQKMAELKAAEKPETANQTEKGLEALLAKAMPNGVVDPKLMSDPVALGKTISQSPQLTDPEKAQLYSHFVFKTSPASAGGIASTRAASILNSRLLPAIDSETDQLGFTTPGQFLAHPGRDIPATQGAAAQTRQAVFSDMHFNLNALKDAYENLDKGFDASTRAQIAMVLRNPNQSSAWDSFFHSSTAGTLTEKQWDLVTALASMNENGMMMRSIQGMGAGSDELRGAIAKIIPGAGTPNKEFADRQISLLEGTIARLEQGVPKTGVNFPHLPNPKKTGESSKFEWKSPDGKQTFTFKSQQDLDNFKKEAGIK